MSYNGPGEVVLFGLYIHEQGFSFCLCILTVFSAFPRENHCEHLVYLINFVLAGHVFSPKGKFWLPIACKYDFFIILKCCSYILSFGD